MVRLLAVADEIVPGLRTDAVRRHRVDLVVGAGDLPFDYLDHLAGTLDVPCVFVPGNHDPDLSGYTSSRGMIMRAGLPADDWPGPPGATNADGRVVEAAGLRIAGLGGSPRYNRGVNQWTESQQARRAWGVRARAWRRPVDLLLTHAPPRDCGDRPDLPHRGFVCLHGLVAALRPRYLVHGHIHPHGQPVPDRQLGHTTVINAVGYRILELAPARFSRTEDHAS